MAITCKQLLVSLFFSKMTTLGRETGSYFLCKKFSSKKSVLVNFEIVLFSCEFLCQNSSARLFCHGQSRGGQEQNSLPYSSIFIVENTARLLGRLQFINTTKIISLRSLEHELVILPCFEQGFWTRWPPGWGSLQAQPFCDSDFSHRYTLRNCLWNIHILMRHSD